ncbi:hypothetical protein [Fischerella sp. PCC 9605]|uniref:hypothetical protein n=1 Tax=Fischerella sp. PCC 9605 TaxID=1173024 RepID=UPI00047D136E|nr:hypothetical protein [Fischerella sp. PCC 9605]
MSEPKVQATFRFPPELLDTVKRRAKQEGISATDLLVAALTEYLGDVEQPQSQLIKELQCQVVELKEEVNNLKKQWVSWEDTGQTLIGNIKVELPIAS